MNIIEIKNLSKRFKENKKQFYALKDVTLGIKKGEIFGILGPNGAGKTTLINIMLDMLIQDEGELQLFGKDPHKQREVLERTGFVSGMSRFHWSLRPKNILMIYGIMHGLSKKETDDRTEKLIKFFNLEKTVPKKFQMLSTGERMRLIFAKALIHHPEILLLDEPTLGLDPDMAIKVRNEIKRINKKFNTTIVLTSHYMQEVEMLANRIAFMDRGRVIDIGKIDHLKKKQFDTYEILVKVRKIKNRQFLVRKGFIVKGNEISRTIPAGEDVTETLHMLASKKFDIVDFKTKRPTLEDYFVKLTGGEKK